MTIFSAAKTEIKLNRLEQRVYELSKELNEIKKEISNIEDSFRTFKQVVLKMQTELEEKPEEGKLMREVYKKLVLPMRKEIEGDYIILKDVLERQKKDITKLNKKR